MMMAVNRKDQMLQRIEAVIGKNKTDERNHFPVLTHHRPGRPMFD